MKCVTENKLLASGSKLELKLSQSKVWLGKRLSLSSSDQVWLDKVVFRFCHETSEAWQAPEETLNFLGSNKLVLTSSLLSKSLFIFIIIIDSFLAFKLGQQCISKEQVNGNVYFDNKTGERGLKRRKSCNQLRWFKSNGLKYTGTCWHFAWNGETWLGVGEKVLPLYSNLIWRQKVKLHLLPRLELLNLVNRCLVQRTSFANLKHPKVQLCKRSSKWSWRFKWRNAASNCTLRATHSQHSFRI